MGLGIRHDLRDFCGNRFSFFLFALVVFAQPSALALLQRLGRILQLYFPHLKHVRKRSDCAERMRLPILHLPCVCFFFSFCKPHLVDICFSFTFFLLSRISYCAVVVVVVDLVVVRVMQVPVI